jgi:hypothetical protein
MCVVVCICYVCPCFYGCAGCCFCKVLSATSVRMREAFPAAALLMCVVSRSAGE